MIKLNKILIAYGSRFGNSEEVALEMAKSLEGEGKTVDVVNLRTTKKKSWPTVENYDAIIIGSGIKITKWTKEPLNFLKKNKELLNKTTFGIYTTAASAVMDHQQAIEDYCVKIINELGLKPKQYDVFGPVMDFSDNSTLDFLNKKMLKLAAMGMANDKPDLQIDLEGRNDFRDWDKIKAFAKQLIS